MAVVGGEIAPGGNEGVFRKRLQNGHLQAPDTSVRSWHYQEGDEGVAGVNEIMHL